MGEICVQHNIIWIAGVEKSSYELPDTVYLQEKKLTKEEIGKHVCYFLDINL